MEHKTIFQSAEIKAIFLPGASDFLLITFAPVQFDSGVEPFWGARLAAKLGLSAIGFVSCTGTNWYPRIDMEMAAAEILETTSNFKKIITYGSSMGAYGALKYSALLNATSCAAFGPQFSIDPKDIGDPQFTRYFRNEIHENMSIQGNEVCHNAYIFFDPHFKFDQDNAHFIGRGASHANLIKIPFAGHEWVKVFANAKAILALFNSCLVGETVEILKLTRIARSQSSARNVGLAQHLIPRNYKMALRVLELSPTPLDKKQEANFYDYAAVAEIKSGNLDQAEIYAIKSLELLPTRASFLRRLGNIYDRKKQFSLAIDCFNRSLSIDAKDSASYFNLASIFFHRNENEEAMNSIMKAIDLVPDEPRYLQLLKRIYAVWKR